MSDTMENVATKEYKRKPITFKQKIEIIDELRRGATRKNLALKYGVSTSTIHKIFKLKDKYLELVNRNKNCLNKTKLKPCRNSTLENKILQFIETAPAKKILINGPIIRKKAISIADQIGYTDFKGSAGWLQNFLKRNCLHTKNLNLINNWSKSILQSLLKQYNHKDIFTASSTALFYRFISDKFVNFKMNNCHKRQLEHSKNILTVLLATNMTGTEKRTPIVIGKHKSPKSLKYIQQLPVDYKANDNASLTSEMFLDWLQNLDMFFKSENRKIVLVINKNSLPTEFIDKTTLTSIEIKYFPTHSESIVQPMDMGIMKNLKILYRNKLVEQLNTSSDGNTVFNFTVLDGINLIDDVWNKLITSSTIVKAFNDAGFIDIESINGIVNDKNYEDDENDEIEEMIESNDIGLDFHENNNSNDDNFDDDVKNINLTDPLEYCNIRSNQFKHETKENITKLNTFSTSADIIGALNVLKCAIHNSCNEVPPDIILAFKNIEDFIHHQKK